MIPFISNFAGLNPYNIPLSYSNAMALNAYSSLLFSSQEQALQSQLFSMLQMRAHLPQNVYPEQQQPAKLEVKMEESISTTSSASSPTVLIAQTDPENKIGVVQKEEEKVIEVEVVQQKSTGPQPMKVQVKEMVKFILNTMGKVDKREVEKMRQKYVDSPSLLPIFDALVAKYSPLKKHREDIVRYVVRRALKFMKSSIIEEEKIYGKRAYAALCKRYFNFSNEELERMGVNTKDEKDLIEFLLPYRKNSKNRTMNISFTSELFSSKEFCNDYKLFLDNFDHSLVHDNTKKIEKLVSLAEECIKKKSVDKINKCSRLPWLQVWIDRTNQIAEELLKENNSDPLEQNIKKVKSITL